VVVPDGVIVRGTLVELRNTQKAPLSPAGGFGKKMLLNAEFVML
jgi:hypothetical protein